MPFLLFLSIIFEQRKHKTRENKFCAKIINFTTLGIVMWCKIINFTSQRASYSSYIGKWHIFGQILVLMRSVECLKLRGIYSHALCCCKCVFYLFIYLSHYSKAFTLKGSHTTPKHHVHVVSHQVATPCSTILECNLSLLRIIESIRFRKRLPSDSITSF